MAFIRSEYGFFKVSYLCFVCKIIEARIEVWFIDTCLK